jgi:hypothetical protein
MAGLSENPDNSEIVNTDYTTKALAITDASEVTANNTGVADANLDFRQILTITNVGPDNVYYGPQGSSVADRDVLYCDQYISGPIGDCINMTFICDTGETATIKVQEWS